MTGLGRLRAFPVYAAPQQEGADNATSHPLSATERLVDAFSGSRPTRVSNKMGIREVSLNDSTILYGRSEEALNGVANPRGY